MKTVCNLNSCAGCMLCAEVCASRAIRIKDELEYYNAYIDEDKCISCGLCHKMCQKNHIPQKINPIGCYEGWANKNCVRLYSSSGGIASELAISFIKYGGYVCSCSFIDGEFGFLITSNLNDIKKMAGSKYVKSNPKGIYSKVKSILKNEGKVLFIALPCQIAAMKNYIPPQYQDNLYLVDLICHGTPSPSILELYLREKEIELSEIQAIEFRHKSSFSLKSIPNEIKTVTDQDEYTMGFLTGLFYTDNCYTCDYACLERCSDLTLGDSWGSLLSRTEKKQGISLVLVQTEKGKELLRLSEVKLMETDIKRAVAANKQLNHPSMKNPKRNFFFSQIRKGRNFTKTVWFSVPKQVLKHFIKTVLTKLHILGGG